MSLLFPFSRKKTAETTRLPHHEPRAKAFLFRNIHFFPALVTAHPGKYSEGFLISLFDASAAFAADTLHRTANGEAKRRSRERRGWGGGETIGNLFLASLFAPKSALKVKPHVTFFAWVCSSCFGLGMSGFGFFRGRGNLYSCSFLLRSPRRIFFCFSSIGPQIVQAKNRQL